MPATESERLRAKGRDLYLAAAAEGIAPVLAATRLQDALCFFNRAAQAAATQLEAASAKKNVAMTHTRLFAAVGREARDACPDDGQAHSETHMRSISHHTIAALNAFTEAHAYGCHTHGPASAWVKRLEKATEASMSDATTVLSDAKPDLKSRADVMCSWLHTLRGKRPVASGVVTLAVSCARTLFSAAVAAHSNDSLVDACSLLAEAEQIHRVALDAMTRSSSSSSSSSSNSLAHGSYLGVEVRVLGQDIALQGKVIRSLKALRAGQRAQEAALEEGVCMNYVWDAVDFYHDAVQQSDGTDVYQEAMAYSNLGVIYTEILKQKQRGKDYCKQAIDLALSMHPRTFEREPWFDAARTTVKKYQDGMQARERDAWEKKRKPHLEKLAPALVVLKTASHNGVAALLRAVYTNHPPKCADPILKEPIDGHKKTRLRKALLHYHPDKNTADGDEWKVLCEEVTKLINHHYNNLKDVSA